MNKFISVTALTLTLTSAAYAGDDKSADKEAGMMQGDMMKNCQSHMKDGKMMDSMSKDMKAQCQEMMKNSGMMQQDGMRDMEASDAAESNTPKATDDAEHAKHHPAQ